MAVYPAGFRDPGKNPKTRWDVSVNPAKNPEKNPPKINPVSVCRATNIIKDFVMTEALKPISNEFGSSQILRNFIHQCMVANN